MKRKRLRWWVLGCGGLAGLCLLAGALSALSNRGLPNFQADTGRPSPLDTSRLEEALHLKEALGESIWPGWGQAPIPVMLWNRDFSFLFEYPGQPGGWEALPPSSVGEPPVLRRPSADPQNFALTLEGQWVASMATKGEMDAFLIESFQGLLPPVVENLFPYRLLIQPSEVQITAVLHESFHAFQGQQAPERLAAAERAHQEGDRYWTQDSAMRAAWREEISLLAGALEAEDEAEAAHLVGRFLQQRRARRQAAALDETLIDFERQLEWEEGLAKYVELAAWQAAFRHTGYQPLPTLAADPDFRAYTTYERRWDQEIGQMKRQAGLEGDTRFYYTGMAQAMLLDRLRPDWKELALNPGVWLEDLLGDLP